MFEISDNLFIHLPELYFLEIDNWPLTGFISSLIQYVFMVISLFFIGQKQKFL